MLQTIATFVLSTVGVVFGAGVLAGAGFGIVGHMLIRWWSRRATDGGDEWTRAVIRAVLAGRTPQAQAKLLQAAYEELVGPCPPPSPSPGATPDQKFN
jgi:hypothetical protein